MKTFPKVFIIILNYNGKNIIGPCLRSVFKNNYPNFEVVVVDNNSQDGSFEEAKMNFSKASFIKSARNLGYAAGNNLGIRFALERMADYVLLLNNDVEVEGDFLLRMVEISERNEKIGIVGSVIFNQDNRDVWYAGGKISWLTMKTRHERVISDDNDFKTEFITGCSMLVRKEVFKKIGLLDEDFFLYWEDADFSVRTRKAGFEVRVAAKSWVYHHEKSQKNLPEKNYWLVISGLLFFRKNSPLWLKPWIFIYVGIRKIKNFVDLLTKKNDDALMVKKAYRDFANVRI
jgi:GT2 family glycosyltransferase